MNKFFKKALAVSITNAICLFSLHASAASYEVIDHGTAETVENTFAQKENGSGSTAILGTGVYDFPIQFEPYLDDDYLAIQLYSYQNYSSILDLDYISEISNLQNGITTGNDLSWAFLYLQSKSSDYTYQKVGASVALINYAGTEQAEVLHIFDTKFDGTSNYTYSTNDYVKGITDEGWIFGDASAPYLPKEYVVGESTQTYWYREFVKRGFYSTDSGHTFISIDPEELDGVEETQYGGTSSISDINSNRVAVGYVSTGIDADASEYIQDKTLSSGCSSESGLAALPFDICVQTLINSATDSIFHTEAYKWQLDSSGVINSEPLGLLLEEKDRNIYDTREFVSVANAINNYDVAVGYATGWTAGVVTNPSATQSTSIYAVVFKNGQVFDLNNNHEDYFNSQAFDINDNGIAVGQATTNVQGTYRTKFFYVDTNQTDDIEMQFPDAFFTSSASTAYAINNNGYIVGEAEVETHSTDSGIARRKHGFLYKIAEQRFTDLNDFLPCDSDYSIVQARGINDDNEITATAIVKAAKRDATGDIIPDSDGEIVYEDVIRAVKLKPIEGGEIESCELTEDKVVRQGASYNGFTLLIFALVAIRRKFAVNKVKSQ